MTRVRFSLISLIGFVLILALACAALSSASRACARATFTFTILVLLIAGLGALFGRGVARAFWTGIALFGGAYVLCVFTPVQRYMGEWLVTNSLLDSLRAKLEERRSSSSTAGVADQSLFVFTEQTRDVMISRRSFNASKVSNPKLMQAAIDSSNSSTIILTASTRPGVADVTLTDKDGGLYVVRVTVRFDYENFYRIGHSLAALLLALIGGLIARYFYITREAQTQPPPAA